MSVDTPTASTAPGHPLRHLLRTAIRNRPASVLGLLALLLLITACSSPFGDRTIDSGTVVTPPVAESATEDEGDGPGLLADVRVDIWSDGSSRAVVTGGPIDVLDAPGGQVLTTLAATTDFGTARVLLVEEELDGWVKVRLPTRPNHRTGWVPASAVVVEDLELSVHVDLSTRSLTVRDGEQTLLATAVAIGTAENPTPVGTFYITDKLESVDPDGAYGPFALGLSGHSETLTEFSGGDGQIGLHGTNDPASIGDDASHGCIRTPNEVIEQLAALLPLGTPVHIVDGSA